MNPMSSEVIDFVKKMKLGCVATVRPDGEPSLSHKGTLTVFDNRHLIFADLTVNANLENLMINPNLVIEVVDPHSRKGFRFRGKARIIPVRKDASSYIAFYETWGLEETAKRVKNFVLIEITYHEQISPVYFMTGCEPSARKSVTGFSNLWKF